MKMTYNGKVVEGDFVPNSTKNEFGLLQLGDKVNVIMDDAINYPVEDGIFSLHIEDKELREQCEKISIELMYDTLTQKEIMIKVRELINLVKNHGICMYKIISKILSLLEFRKREFKDYKDDFVSDLKEIVSTIITDLPAAVINGDSVLIKAAAVNNALPAPTPMPEGIINCRQVVINAGCICCGICSELDNIFIENPDGTVYVSASACVTEQNIEKLKEIVEECPAKCISFKQKEGKYGSLDELKDALIKELGDYKFPMPDRADYDFNKEDYRVIPRSGSGQRAYDYTSERRAISAGLAEFNRCMYSQMKPIIIELLVDYKNKKLMQFVKYERKQGDFYYDNIFSVEQIIAEFLVEIQRLSGKEIKNIEEFARINSKPQFDLGDHRHVAWDITNFEEFNFINEILTNIDPCYKYELYINTDDWDRYDGRREKTYYCYTLYEVCEQLAKDILWATDYVMNRNEATERIVQGVVKDSVKNIEKEIREKYMKILNVVGNLLY